MTYNSESIIKLHLFLSHPFNSRCDLHFECLLLSNYTYFCHICFLADLLPLPHTRILINTETGLTYLRFAGFLFNKTNFVIGNCLNDGLFALVISSKILPHDKIGLNEGQERYRGVVGGC